MLGKLKPYHNSYGQSCWAAVWLLVCYGVFLKSSFAQDSWQFFRGNRFDGHSDAVGIADRWSEKGPPVFWSRELGSGYSGFVGEDGRVFTQYQSLSGQFVTCLDLKSGATIWEHRYAWPYKPASLYPGPRSTPTLADGYLFYTTPTAQIGCLNLQNGKLIWERDLGTQFKAPPVEFGYACSPVCADGRVLLPVGGKNASMVALDQLTGEVIWHSGNEAISYCSAYPIEFQGRSLVVGYFKNKLCIYDRSNGNELTQVQVSNDYDEHSAWPIYREPYLWISGPFRAGSKLYRIDQDEGRDTISLRRIDSSSIMSNDVASSVLVDDALYGFDLKDVQSKVHRPSRGRFICIDFLSGDLKWANGSLGRRLQRDEQTVASKQRVNDSDVGHCSVIHADGKLVLFNDTGELILCRVDPNEFKPLDRCRILGGEICWVQPAIVDQCFLVRNHTTAVCVYLGNNKNEEIDQLKLAVEIPQPKYVDLAAWILGTEPKYAMTAPGGHWLSWWYLISVGLGWMVFPLVAWGISRSIKQLSQVTLLRVLQVTLGILGMTISGHFLGQFYFSWPIFLFLAFEWVVFAAHDKQNQAPKMHPLLARVWLVCFLILCYTYFWFCRRLSLAFEWTFLMGFPFALPFLWWVRRASNSSGTYPIKKWFFELIAFSIFYWVGAGVILWKY